MPDYDEKEGKVKEVFSINLRTKLRNFVGLGNLRIGGVIDGGDIWGESWVRYDWTEVQAQAQPPVPPGWTEVALSSYDVAVRTSAKVALESVQPEKKDKPSS